MELLVKDSKIIDCKLSFPTYFILKKTESVIVLNQGKSFILHKHLDQMKRLELAFNKYFKVNFKHNEMLVEGIDINAQINNQLHLQDNEFKYQENNDKEFIERSYIDNAFNNLKDFSFKFKKIIIKIVLLLILSSALLITLFYMLKKNFPFRLKKYAIPKNLEYHSIQLRNLKAHEDLAQIESIC